MMRHELLVIFLSTCLLSCNNQSESNGKKVDDTFKLTIEPYQFLYKEKNYVALMNEQHYYFILDGQGLVKSKEEYFLSKNKFLMKAIELDSSWYSNNKYNIVFFDSCSQNIVDYWVKKFKEDPKGTNKLLINDTTVLKSNNLNCIYYTLLTDSFMIFQDDISGYFNIVRH